jgi:hypothetical protein
MIGGMSDRSVICLIIAIRRVVAVSELNLRTIL